MQNQLPPNHKIFVDEWLTDRNGKRSAIAAGFAEKSAEVTASRLLRNAKVKQYIDQRLLLAQKRRAETLDDILNELDENRKAALHAETVQSSAATAATMAKAKLLGFVIDKVKMSGDAENPLVTKSTIDVSGLSSETLKELIKAKDAINRV